MKLLPPFYGWTMKRKIHKHYRAISRLERRLGLEPPEELLNKLAEIERDVHELYALPAAFAAPAHSLRIHIKHVKERIKAVGKMSPVSSEVEAHE